MGNALWRLAQVSESEERAELLSRAESAYGAALEVYTRAAAPFGWAATQFNLASLSWNWAGDGPTAAATCARLGQALACMDEALTVFRQDTVPMYHAQGQRIRAGILQQMREVGCK